MKAYLKARANELEQSTEQTTCAEGRESDDYKLTSSTSNQGGKQALPPRMARKGAEITTRWSSATTELSRTGQKTKLETTVPSTSHRGPTPLHVSRVTDPTTPKKSVSPDTSVETRYSQSSTPFTDGQKHRPLGVGYADSSAGTANSTSLVIEEPRLVQPKSTVRARTRAAAPQIVKTIRTRGDTRDSIRPPGPKHLEYDYSLALNEFKAVVYEGLGQLGYIPPKGVDRRRRIEGKQKGEVLPPLQVGLSLDLKAMLKAIPAVASASVRLDIADRALEEALARGETWENTPVPLEFCWGHPSLRSVEYMRVSHQDQMEESNEARSPGPHFSRRCTKKEDDTVSTITTPRKDSISTSGRERNALGMDSGSPSTSPTVTDSLSLNLTADSSNPKKRKIGDAVEDREHPPLRRQKRVRRQHRDL